MRSMFSKALVCKTVCVLVLALLGGAMTGCCARCEDGWGHYKECDILDGTYTTNWPGCSQTERRVCRPRYRR